MSSAIEKRLFSTETVLTIWMAVLFRNITPEREALKYYKLDKT